MKQIALLVVAVLVAGCATAPPPPKEVFYRFDTLSGIATGNRVIEGTLRLEPIRAQGILSERAILFSKAESPNRLEQYRYHHWEKPPAQLLTQALLISLQSSGLAEKVVPADVRSPADFSIDGELLRLERVFEPGKDSVAVEILLRLKRYSTRELLLQERYLETFPVEKDNLPAVVSAMSAARTRIYERFAGDIRTQLRTGQTAN